MFFYISVSSELSTINQLMDWISFALLAAVFLGSNMIVSKKVLTGEHALEFLAASSLAGLVFILPAMFFFRPSVLPPVVTGIILLKAITAFFFFYFGARALRHMELSSYAPLTNLSPILLILLGYLFLGEKLTSIQILGVLTTVFGAYILELNDGLKSLKTPFLEIKKNKYIHYVLFSLLAGSFSIVLDRYILKTVPLVDFYFYQRIMIDILIIVSLFLFFDGSSGVKKVFNDYRFLIFISVVLYLLGDLFYFKAISFPTAYIALIIPVKRLSSLFATFFGGEIFHEDHLLRKTLACVIMVVGVFMIIR